ncbi:DUF1801 domain-containing protein [Aquisphaera insulae]|uniref:DUF1801 domain-containing protein n=1 Tax=Aquisphaera insulae TaxID=2712864 RepID=UPI0013EBEAD8|nr:DUF1801 domain-containing protein [Aquisphaera insulae]
MARSNATTVADYLAELPEDRRGVVAAVRELILAHLPDGYRETMNWGMICYEVPLERYPKTYNKQPLSYAALAAQKGYYSVYLNGIYPGTPGEGLLRKEFDEAGKRLNMGKCCVRFRSLDDLVLDAIGRAVASTPVDTFIADYEASRKGR